MQTTDENNAETSRQEVAEFIASPPGRYFAYHNGMSLARFGVGEKISTWKGDRLGRVTSTGRIWRSNFGDRRQNFRMIAVNGKVYSGTAYLDAGDYVRIRRVAAK